MVRATLINYFDVWGNEEDGWEINNLCKEADLEFEVNKASDVTNEMILDKLIEVGFLVPTCIEGQLDFCDLWPMIEINQADNYCPLCRLEFED